MKRLAMVLVSFAVITGCTSEPPPTEKKVQPPELLTGRSSFQQLYIAAHGWAADVRPYMLQSQVIGDNKGRDGKAVLWRAGFSSDRMHGSKPYVWSGIDATDVPARGISPGTQDSYIPANSFDVAFLKVDSDKALEVAQKHGGDKFTDTPVLYSLEWNKPGNNLVWHVIYGNSRNEAKLTVDVDATSGEFIRKEK